MTKIDRNAGALALAKVLTDPARGAAVKVTLAEFQALSGQLTKIAKANPKIAMDVVKLMQKKHGAGDFDIKDIGAIPSHGAAVSNALKQLKSSVDLADGRRDEPIDSLAK